MGRAMGSLGDLAQAKQLTEETESIVLRLRGALGSGDPVNAFRDMRHERERTIALNNRVAKVKADLLAADAKAVAGAANPELTSVRQKRRDQFAHRRRAGRLFQPCKIVRHRIRESLPESPQGFFGVKQHPALVVANLRFRTGSGVAGFDLLPLRVQ